MTLSIVMPAALTATAGIIMMLPYMRRRAAERGLSGSIEVPSIIAATGLMIMIGGFLL